MDFYLLLEIQVKSEAVNAVTLNNHAKKSATDALETASKRSNQKTTEATGDLIEKKIADKITRVTETAPKTNSETNEEEILRERYISSEKRQKVSGNLR